jgi:hypothetical protein
LLVPDSISRPRRRLMDESDFEGTPCSTDSSPMFFHEIAEIGSLEKEA